MKQYLFDVPTLTSFWVDAESEEEALHALDAIARGVELRIQIGGKTPIEFVDFTIRGTPELIEIWPEDETELLSPTLKSGDAQVSAASS